MLPTKWPQWIIIPIGFLLVAALIGLGLGMVMAVQAFAGGVETVVYPTPPPIAYAAHVSTACTDCHVDEDKLSESAPDEEIQRLYIAPEDTQVLHGQLGCVTCHLGTPDTEDVATAHTGIVVDPSIDRKEGCLQCHPALPNELPDSGLIAPHEQVIGGSAQDLACSDCHGSVGHGYDPSTGEVTISMAACLDCHEERGLAVQADDCEACHIESPAWTPEADCDMCHSLDERSYVELEQNPDLLAHAHAREGLACVDCHEQAALEESHVGAVPGAAVEPQTYDSEFCTGCHLDNEHTSQEQVAERTAELSYNPHESHLIGELECGACHKNHRPSQEQCTGCHKPVATSASWTAEVTPTIEIQLWEPDMDCTACKSMASYASSLENASLMGSVHAQEGLTCLDCHDAKVIGPIHEEARPDGIIRVKKIDNEFCFDCHVENEHASLEQVIGRTADYIIDGMALNPHDPHIDDSEIGEIECYRCHKMHKESPQLSGCYGCHHKMTLESCDVCHGS